MRLTLPCLRAPPAGTVRPRGVARLPFRLLRATSRWSLSPCRSLALAGGRVRWCERSSDDRDRRPPRPPRRASARACRAPPACEATVYATRAAQRLGVRVRRARAALGDDLGGRPTSARRRLRDSARGRHSDQGDQRPSGARSGSLWHGGRLYVTSLGRVDVFSGLHGSRFAAAQGRSSSSRPATAGTTRIVALPDGRLAMGISSACDHCVEPLALVGDDRLVPPGRQRRARLRARASARRSASPTTAATGALLTSMNQRDDLGARTPGDWLALVREGQNWRFPGCYGQGGSACAGVPTPLAVLDKHAAAAASRIVSRATREGRRPRGARDRVGAGQSSLRVPLRRAGSGVRERARGGDS